MSILASLARAYERLPNAPPFGYSSEKIGFLISLNADGSLAHVIDLREGEGNKKRSKSMMVPQPVKRTVNIAANFLWDKTAYVLGVTAGEGKRTADEHAAFLKRHLDALEGTEDEGLLALAAFLKNWRPENFTPTIWPDDAKDQNVVFCLEQERLQNVMLHDRPAAKALWARAAGPNEAESQICLVTGERGPIARLHPSIKGVRGAQSAGAAIVSFNLDAFTSYGHEQGDNASISEAAAFAYTAALNRFLMRDSGHRLQIGDASTVFWADASSPELAQEAESLGAAFFADEPVNFASSEEAGASKRIAEKLKGIREGKSLRDIDPKLPGVRFYVLGLAPNAARLSVRFYFEDNFGVLTANYQRYLADMAFNPWPQGRKLTLASSVLRTAPARIENRQLKFDRDQVSPLLAGELLRSVLTASRFPGGLLSLLLLRIRADQVLDATRVALIKGFISRAMRLDGRLPTNSDGTPKEDYLMRSDPDDPNPARRLGRLFALIERAQLTALGDDINATVKDKFLSAAAATPRQVFSALLENAENHHLKRLRNGHSGANWVADIAKKTGQPASKVARNVGAALNADIGRLAAKFDGFPAQHTLEEQGLFMIGYYQERYGQKKNETDGPDEADDNLETAQTNDGEE